MGFQIPRSISAATEDGLQEFPMHKSDFSPFSDPFMLSVDASGVVPVGVRPPPPLRGSSPCEAGQFFHGAQTVIITEKSPEVRAASGDFNFDLFILFALPFCIRQKSGR